jgi:acyl dehydratase
MDRIELFKGFSKQLLFQVTEKIYHAFQDCSGDMNPLHIDEEFACTKGFPQKVMYGNILNAFISYAVGMELPTKEVMLQSQDIQYRNPVFLRDCLLMDIRVEEIHESVRAVELSFKFTNDAHKVVAKGNIQIGVF